MRKRALDRLAAFILFTFVIGIIASFITGDARIVLTRESVYSGVIGLVMLGSLVIGRPLPFYFGRQFAGRNGPAGDWWEERWQASAEFRHTFRVVTVVWRVVLIIDAIVRLSNAEDPARGFLPTAGVIDDFAPPGGPFTRVDTYVEPGTRVPPDYDPLLAKVAVWAPDRHQALVRMERALTELRLDSRTVVSNTAFLREVLANPQFRAAKHNTTIVDQILADRAGR